MVLCVCCAYDRWPVCTKLIPGLGNAAHDLSFSWRIVGGFFLALLFYEVRPWQAVFASGAFFTLIALVEVLAMLLIGLRIPDTDILMQAGAARLVYVVFSNLIQVPLVVLISHFFSRKGNALRILWLLPIIAIQIASIAVCYVA